MPVDFNGYWKMLSNENFEEYLRALDVNVALRKIANLLKPDKEIVQDGDHMIIRTLSTFRNYIMDFQVGKEFEEDLTGIDDRKCMTTVSWDGDKLQCVQKGEKEGRGWTQWIEGDELHLLSLSNTLQSLDPKLPAACILVATQPSLRPFIPSHLQCQATDATTTSDPAA
uniref:Retinol binding protein 1 n=1 Tax=Rattus norvegicus TaxID=10116 RepID=A0ABK0M847_RAT